MDGGNTAVGMLFRQSAAAGAGELFLQKITQNAVEQTAGIGKYKNGQYAQYPDLIRHFRTDHLKIICDKPTSINLDGELRISDIVDISIAKEKLRFFYPAQLTLRTQAQPVGI